MPSEEDGGGGGSEWKSGWVNGLVYGHLKERRVRVEGMRELVPNRSEGSGLRSCNINAVPSTPSNIQREREKKERDQGSKSDGECVSTMRIQKIKKQSLARKQAMSETLSSKEGTFDMCEIMQQHGWVKGGG